MNQKPEYERPFIVGRWPARSDSSRAVAEKILATLGTIESGLGMDFAWNADVGGEHKISIVPFSTELGSAIRQVESFAKFDDAGRLWRQGGLALPLYGTTDNSKHGDLISLTGTVGALTRRGNSLQIAFLKPEAVPSLAGLAAITQAVGEIWEMDWCAGLSDEVIEAVNKPFGEPGVGFVSYWGDALQATLPSTEQVDVRKTSKGTLAELKDWSAERAIEYANLVHHLRVQ